MKYHSSAYEMKKAQRMKNLIWFLAIVLIVLGVILIISSVKSDDKSSNKTPNLSTTSNGNYSNIISNEPSSDLDLINSQEDISNVEGDVISDNDVTSTESKEIPADYVEYTGPIEHIFFHPLVAYPELAFDGDYQSVGMDEVMTTASEFKRVLEECYKNDYILINVEEYFGYYVDEKDDVKKFGRLPMYLPEGKKPLIISTDDMNYYTYMRENGCNYKMVIGEDGNIAMYSKNPKGEDVISYDTEVVTILDKFVKDYPDFSHNGAKGVIGVTGYDGILGYRTNRENLENRQEEIEAVKPIVARLKETGWTFASHSYGHPHFNSINYEKVKDDTDKFKNEVTPLIGETFMFLFPYGEWPEHNGDKFEYLYSSGFRYFSGVGIKQYMKNHGGRYVFDDRKNIDGYTLRNRADRISHMMDANKVIDLQARGSEPGKGIGVK